MGFADEVNQTFRGTTPAPVAATEVAPAEAPAETAEPHALDAGLEIPQTLGETAPLEPKVEAAPAPAVTVDVPIKIGTQTFTNVEEAMRYANELELAVLQSEAYEAGKREAAPKPEQATEAVRTIEDEISEQLFDDPKTALLKYKQAIKEEIKAQIVSEAQQEKTRTETWNNFYSANADLAQNTDVVEYVLQKNWNKLGGLPATKALEELATMTRAFLGSAKETQLPTRELSSKKVVQPTGSEIPTKAQVATEKSALDFISQVNKHRKRDTVLKA